MSLVAQTIKSRRPSHDRRDTLIPRQLKKLVVLAVAVVEAVVGRITGPNRRSLPAVLDGAAVASNFPLAQQQPLQRAL
jgi:hypothetical protein